MKHFKLFLLLFCLPGYLPANEVSVNSPDGKYLMKVFDKDNYLWFTVSYGGKTIIYPSVLGINGSG
ncbi:MAG: hypothetical protein LBJ47_05210, partial [Tannerella sp.]|nr:hypothetical protein [Tannerella sp.]